MNNIKIYINYWLNAIKKNKLTTFTIIILLLVMFVKVDYTVYAPGGAINVQERLTNTLYDSDGSFNLTYVTSIEGNIPTVLLSYIMPNWDLVKNEDILVENEDYETMVKRELISLYESVSNSTYVAYTSAGFDVNITDSSYYVYYVYDEADTTLQAGDKILSFDGNDFVDGDDLRNYLSKKKSGDEISLTVERDGNETTARASVIEVNDKKVLGILVDTIYSYNNDPDIHYSYKASELGSSGGLMLTLSIYNGLVEEDITEGLKISGTGTIKIDGTVGAIGGVKYKIMGAVANDCDVFIVPADNYDEAVKVAKDKNYDIKIIKAENFKQVVEELQKLKK